MSELHEMIDESVLTLDAENMGIDPGAKAAAEERQARRAQNLNIPGEIATNHH